MEITSQMLCQRNCGDEVGDWEDDAEYKKDA